MLNDIYKGKSGKVESFFENNSVAIATTFENGQTALHVAITAGQLRVAKELIKCTGSEKSHHLEIQDESGNTGLSLAARSGIMEIAKCLIEKNEKLLTIPDGDNKVPVQLACRAGHEDMTRYLYRNTSRKFPNFLDGDYGFYLLEECITKKMFDIALHLLYSFPKFGKYSILMEGKDTKPIILTLAQTPPLFFGRNQLSFWKRWIYNCTRVKVDQKTVLADGVGFIAAQRRAKKIYDLKMMDATACEIIHFICGQLSDLDQNEFARSGAVEAAFQAIENGIPEIAIKIAEVNTNILWNRPDPGGPGPGGPEGPDPGGPGGTGGPGPGGGPDPGGQGNMFAWAVAHRQEKVARFLYGFYVSIGIYKISTIDKDENNLLHLAAKLAPPSHLDYILGAALQLQSELRWFMEVKGIVPQSCNYDKNKMDKSKPFQLFVKEHKQLLKEAEEWVKKTAESSTVVGALIITIMFAVAFTVPGGNDQNTGFPIFLNKTTDSSTVPSPTVPFMTFVVSDAISLFAASSSVLMFLGIRASRYAYEDFFKSLPVKLIIGISSLFISIAAMMVAFCAALFIMLQGHLWIIIPIILLAGIPIIIFVLSLSPFLVELYTLTFGPGIFDRKRTTAWEK